MRKRLWFKRLGAWIAPSLWWFFTVLGVITVALSASSPIVNENDRWIAGIWNSLVSWTAKNKGWMIPVNAGFLSFTGYLLKHRSQNRLDMVIKNLLDKCRDTSFPKEHEYVDYRVTLFKHEQWHFGGWMLPILWSSLNWRGENFKKWPGSGWLVPYERSGEFHLDSGVYFYAPKASVEQAEGIAGALYRSKLASYILKLPKLSSDPTDLQINKYCDVAKITPQFVRRKLAAKRPLPLSFWGTYVEVDSKAWGVLVVDSRKSELPTDLSEKFGPTLTCISQLLSKRSQ